MNFGLIMILKKYKLEKYFFFLFLLTIGIDPYSKLILVNFPLHKLVSFILIFLFLINYKQNITIIKNIFKKKSVLTYIVVYTFISMFLSYLISMFFQGSIAINIHQRFWIQVLSLITSIVIGIYFYKYLLKDISFVKSSLLKGLKLVLFFCIMQLILEPLGVWPSLFGGLFRLNGMSGEPKMLAIFLLPFVVFYLLVDFKKNKLFSIFMLACMLLTLSTSAFISFILVIFLYFGIRRSFNLKHIVILGILTCIIISSPIFMHAFQQKIINRLIYEEVLNSESSLVVLPLINLPVVVDGNEASPLVLLLSNPWIVLTGVGYGMETVYSYLYFNDETNGFLPLSYNGVISPNNSLLRNTLYFGLPLLLFMLISIYRTSKRIISNRIYFSNNELFFAVFILSSLVTNFLIFSNTIRVIPLLFISKALLERSNNINE